MITNLKTLFLKTIIQEDHGSETFQHPIDADWHVKIIEFPNRWALSPLSTFCKCKSSIGKLSFIGYTEILSGLQQMRIIKPTGIV
jgi:hypothetical protein